MSDWEKTIIPLDAADEILSSFGISPSSLGYRRWRRGDGFRQVDFENILAESRFVINVDWREWLQDAVDTIIRQLDDLEMEATVDLGEDGEEGEIQIGSRIGRIKYVPADNDDFDLVIKTINSLIAERAQYRKFRSCEGSDGWSYAVLRKENWQALDLARSATVKLLFV